VRKWFTDIYSKCCNKWWDSYTGQEVVLLEDFDKAHRCLGHHMKIWSDKFAFQAEQKGSSIMIRPKLVVITSNYLIEEIFGDDEALTAAIKRRMQFIEVTLENRNMLSHTLNSTTDTGVPGNTAPEPPLSDPHGEPEDRGLEGDTNSEVILILIGSGGRRPPHAF